jgi:hypothetical protein
MVSPNPLTQVTLDNSYKSGTYTLILAEAQAACWVMLHPTFLGIRHGQSADVLLLHFRQKTVVLDLLHDLPHCL